MLFLVDLSILPYFNALFTIHLIPDIYFILNNTPKELIINKYYLE